VEWRQGAAGLFDGTRRSLVLVGRAGAGKSKALDEIEHMARAADVSCRRLVAHRFDVDEDYALVEDLLDPELFDQLLNEPSRVHLRDARQQLLGLLSPGVIIVENTQWIDAASLRLLAALASRTQNDGLRMVVSIRPRSNEPELAALTEILISHDRSVMVGPLSEEEACNLLRASALGDRPPDELIRIAESSRGAHFLLSAVVDAAQSDPESVEHWLDGGSCPPMVLESVRSRAAVLDPTTQQVFLAMSFGASATTELIDILDLEDESALGDAVSRLDDEGLLCDDGSEVVPLVASAVAELQTPVERRRHHLRFADVLAERGGSAVLRAEHLKAGGASPRDLASACLLAADELIADAPPLALEWIEQGLESGAQEVDVASRRVEALLRDGRPMESVQAAESLFRSEGPGRLHALQHAAVAFAKIRRPQQAASILGQIAPRLDGDDARLAEVNSALCSMIIGGDEGVRAPASTGTASDPSVEVAQLSHAALESALHAPNSAALEEAVAGAAGAADLELSAMGSLRSPYSAHVIAVNLAQLAADPLMAARLARAARGAYAMTDSERRSRVLLAALAELWGGSTAAGDDPMAGTPVMGAGDQLVSVAVVAGRARRSNDVVALRSLGDAVHQVLMQAPDLLSLPAFGEVMVAAARMELTDLVQDARAARDRFMAGLGSSTMLRVAANWIDVQCAAASDDLSHVETCDFDSAAAEFGGRLGLLDLASATWHDLMHQRADAEEVRRAGQLLERLGYRWEAARLVGSAAMRLEDESAARTLLATARELRAGLSKVEEEALPLSALLSARELEVAQLVLAGNTYKEVGGRLFISPKTVEHHVARIRQRLDANSRAEMLEILRASLAPGQ